MAARAIVQFRVRITKGEDIAIGPGPITNLQYLYVGDIGDNNVSRSSVVI